MNDKLNRGFKYFMRTGGLKNSPVNATMILAKRPPKDGTHWVDVTACVKVCCSTDVITAEDITVTQTTRPLESYDVETLSAAVSSRGNALTFSTYSHTVDNVIIDLNSSGTLQLTVDNDVTTNTSIELPVTITDVQGAVKQITVTINVNYVAA